MKNFDLSNKTFVPQNVYKAICKYALSLMPHSLTLHYQKTIEWIQSDSFEHSLPKIKMASFDREGNEPIMALFLRKNDNKRFPLCIASLCVANIHLFYLLPFSDESESTEQDNILFDSFFKFKNSDGLGHSWCIIVMLLLYVLLTWTIFGILFFL